MYIQNVLLVNEFSTFFLNYRQFLLIFKKHETSLYKWNAIAFFLSFLISRILFNSVVAYWVGRAFYLTTINRPVLDHPVWQICVGFYLIGLFVVINILNLIWFTGILRHVKRNMMSRSGNEEVIATSEQINKSREEVQRGFNYSSIKEVR